MVTGNVVVIGAGVIGPGVAQCFAEHGYPVTLIDVNDAALSRARDEIGKGAQLRALLKKTRVSPSDVLSRITMTTDADALARADFIVESVTESWEVKEPLYRRIDALCPPHCVLASNTSCIPITRIASATRRAPRVVGTHFMNPAPLKDTVEVIRGYHTSDETLEATRALLAKIGKESIVVEDAPGFVSNRVLMLAINEAIFLLEERVARAEDVDRIFTSCFGHKMGPLETADLIGLDTILRSLEVLHSAFGDTKFRPCPLLRKLVDAGRLGRKTGGGIFDYEARPA